MSDFRSLLSTFQAATSTSTSSNRSSSTQNNRNNSNSRNGGKHNDKDDRDTKDFDLSSLRERTDRLWRITQIRRSTMADTSSSRQEGSSVVIPGKNVVRIAACACIVDAFPHEFVWKKWMEETGGDVVVPLSRNGSGGGKSSSSSFATTATTTTTIQATAELYVHAKNPEKIASPWLRSKTIGKTYRPNWNDVRIVRAMLALTAEALKDESTTHILYCTESCIPITSLRDAALVLLTGSRSSSDDRSTVESEDKSETRGSADDGVVNWHRSFVDFYGRDSRRCTKFDEQSCWDVLAQSVPPDAIHKALPGWCLLSRKHAQAVLDIPSHLDDGELWPAFSDVWAPEEVYFPTALSLLGYLPSKEVVGKTVTYAKWDVRARNQKDRAHPLEYDDCFNKYLVRDVQREGCLFMRKMKRPMDVRIWERVVLEEESREADATGDQYGEESSKKRRRDYTHDNGGYHGADYGGRSRHSSSRRRYDRSDYGFGSRYR